MQTPSSGLVFYQKKTPILMLFGKVKDNVSEKLNGPVEPEPEQNTTVNYCRIINIQMWKKEKTHLS